MPNALLSGAKRPSEERAMLNDLLCAIPIEKKAAVFDALVREFYGTGRIVHFRYAETRRGGLPPNIAETGMDLELDKIPVYEYTLRSDGSSNFLSAIMALADT
jgi:hypothetical protein